MSVQSSLYWGWVINSTKTCINGLDIELQTKSKPKIGLYF